MTGYFCNECGKPLRAGEVIEKWCDFCLKEIIPSRVVPAKKTEAA